MSIRDEMDNFFEDNKAFATFQVCEANDPIVSNLSFTPFHIRFGYEFTGFGGDALYFHNANVTSVLGKHVAPPFSITHVDFDNATAPPKLTMALGKSVSHIQQIAGQKYVLSLTRNSEGAFAIHLTRCWFSHTQTIDRFIASVVTKNPSIVLEQPILPRTPPSSFTASCILPRTFPKI